MTLYVQCVVMKPKTFSKCGLGHFHDMITQNVGYSCRVGQKVTPFSTMSIYNDNINGQNGYLYRYNNFSTCY